MKEFKTKQKIQISWIHNFCIVCNDWFCRRREVEFTSNLSILRSSRTRLFFPLRPLSLLDSAWHSRVARVLELCHLWIKNNYTVAAIINLCAFFMITDHRAWEMFRYEIKSALEREWDENVKWGKELDVRILTSLHSLIKYHTMAERKKKKAEIALQFRLISIAKMKCNNVVKPDSPLFVQKRSCWCPGDIE